MLKVLIGYPSPEEFVVVERMIRALAATQRVLSADSLREYQRQVDQVYVDPGVIEYAVHLANATRNPAIVGKAELARYLTFGASPRLDQHGARRSRARLPPRAQYALASDVRDLARDVCGTASSSRTRPSPRTCSDDLLTPILATTHRAPMRERRPRSRYAPGFSSQGDSPWTRPPR